MVKAVPAVLNKRGFEVPAEVRERVVACADPAVLEVWFDRAFEVSKASDIFAD
ncbi:hypothetical protein [Nocardia sp. SYP-A9097]|uniref:hypothetical protein n=1 Tax=Nocardia sp. SYP-A9097 TaxID=2663237 RepID=UPI001E52F074|nr:hypothetical protein [Nocardia sp. SYP-A9097]